MVGSLVLVGEGKWSADDLAHALAARDRAACGPVAPPDGLYPDAGGLLKFSASSRATPDLVGGRPGTHTPQRLDRARRMGPRLRGDDGH